MQIDESDIFNRSRKIDDPKQRQAYLEEACGSDLALLERISRLLQAYDTKPGFLESRPVELGGTVQPSTISEGPGTVLGQYKLLEVIGEGGFAVVYMSEQQEPIRRTVALKIVKLGMDTKQVIARFEAERQALAMMDHPGIANVYDAGTTSTGRPFFVMQLIRGVPITEYCDEHCLTTEQRLRLFVAVCHAVQHAHQKGVIHRDIKPSNVLVALHDGEPVPKVIDFGIAKATRQRLTEKTLYTSYHQIVGTPQYMSPEQAEFSDLDVDTRSDIYSLGVLLFELLVGKTPLGLNDLRGMTYDEICKTIRQSDVQTPSRTLSALGESAQHIASARQTDLPGLRKVLKGELDCVVMKTMERNRSRRYETADALAADLLRYSNGEPVLAHPPSTIYQLKRAVRRHRIAVGTVCMVFLFIVSCLVIATVAMLRIDREHKNAETERDQARKNLEIAQDLIEDVIIPASTKLEVVSTADAVQRSKAHMLDQTLLAYERILHQGGDNENTRRMVIRACNQRIALSFHLGESGDDLIRRVTGLLRKFEDEDFFADAELKSKVAYSYQGIGGLHWRNLRWNESARHYSVAVRLWEELAADSLGDKELKGDLLTAQAQLAYAIQGSGNLDLADTLYGESSGAPAIDEVIRLANWATLLILQDRYPASERCLRESLALIEQRANEDAWGRTLTDFWAASAHNRYGKLHIDSSRLAEAELHLDKSVVLGNKLLKTAQHIPFIDNTLGWANVHLGELTVANGSHNGAVTFFETAREHWRSAGSTMAEYNSGLAELRLGEVHHQLGNSDQARRYFNDAKNTLEKISAERPNEPYCQDRLIVLLSNCPDESFRDSNRAVLLAKKVLTPSNGPLRRCLALSQYRCGSWGDAEQSIRTCLESRNGGDALDHLILAMAQWQLGKHAVAVETFEHVENEITSKSPVFYGDIGVMGFQRLRSEAKSLRQSKSQSANE